MKATLTSNLSSAEESGEKRKSVPSSDALRETRRPVKKRRVIIPDDESYANDQAIFQSKAAILLYAFHFECTSTFLSDHNSTDTDESDDDSIPKLRDIPFPSSSGKRARSHLLLDPPHSLPSSSQVPNKCPANMRSALNSSSGM